ncbi:venom metalloproteinase antarease-like TpachMP_A [Centruroides sculpturatus]|uniref:venom metalloproteinase antarease-like TpachMP_A n=1 Tax=Centruroides sculpturatus TaxID=218467 RepID=UPI000C6DE5F0|nr:venom metalloproteinase antarease-like TpachMP_A [Centruroides sculpturatus]
MELRGLKIISILFYFVTISAFLSGGIDVIYPSVITLRSGAKILKFRLLEEDVELRLEPAGKVISDNFTVVNGKGERDESIDVKQLKSKLYKNEKIGAALHIDEGKSLKVHGIINSYLRIEPFGPEEMARKGKRAHHIIELKKDKNVYIKDQVIPKKLEKLLNPKARILNSNECLVIKYVFITESTFTESFIERNIGLTDYVATMFVQVQNLFNTLELNIEICMVGILAYTKLDEASFIEQSVIPGYEEYLNCEDLLDNMAIYFYSNPIEYRHVEWADMVILLVKRKWGDLINGDVYANTAGISFVGGVCDGRYKYGVCEDDANFMERADTIAHESGHLLGCPHDGEGPAPGIPHSPGSEECPESQGYLMSSSQSKENGQKFSPCCRENVQNLLLWIETAQSIIQICKFEGDDNDNHYYNDEDYQVDNYNADND